MTFASIVLMTTLAETEPPRANFSPPAPPRVTLTSTPSACARISTVDPVELSVEATTCDVTVLKMRLTPTAAPAPALPVETAMPPASATLTSLSRAANNAGPPANTALSVTCASIVLAKTFSATDPAMASFCDPAPPTASVTTVPSSPAVALNAPSVRRVESSTEPLTVLVRTFTAMAAPSPAVLPAANPPAKQ